MLLEFRASNTISGRKKWSVFLFLIISNLNFCSFRLSGNTALAGKKRNNTVQAFLNEAVISAIMDNK